MNSETSKSFANAGSLTVQLGNVLCKVFNGAGNVTAAHTVVAIYMIACLTMAG